MLFLRHWSAKKKVVYQLILKFCGGEAFLHFCLYGEFSEMVFVGGMQTSLTESLIFLTLITRYCEGQCFPQELAHGQD